ncbi:MAG: hypothetical protein V5B32_03020 [Candidatus Accumulibacter sp. UW26]|jgi:hypothetical protein
MLPADLLALERGWPSSNNRVSSDRVFLASAGLVGDNGYVTHAAQSD